MRFDGRIFIQCSAGFGNIAVKPNIFQSGDFVLSCENSANFFQLMCIVRCKNKFFHTIKYLYLCCYQLFIARLILFLPFYDQ